MVSSLISESFDDEHPWFMIESVAMKAMVINSEILRRNDKPPKICASLSVLFERGITRLA